MIGHHSSLGGRGLLRPRSRRDVAPGFTLVELMIAMVLTTLVVVATWRGLSDSARYSKASAALAIVYERLGLATELIANDARLAGWQTSPNSDVDPNVCIKPAETVRGMMIDEGETSYGDGDTLVSWGGSDNAFIEPDACIFLTTPNTTLFRPTAISGNTIDFSTDLTLGELSAPAFEGLFDDRFLSILSPTGDMQFVDVIGTDGTGRAVTVSPAPVHVSDSGGCGIETTGGDDHIVTVHHNVRYRIIADPNNDEGTVLLREEVSRDMSTIIPGTRLVVAENIVDLQCWLDGETLAGQFRTDGTGADSVSNDEGSLGDFSPTSIEIQRARIFHFKLTARTDREFDSVLHQPRNNRDFDGLMRTFNLDDDGLDAALAQTVHQQVELTNFSLRDLL